LIDELPIYAHTCSIILDTIYIIADVGRHQKILPRFSDRSSYMYDRAELIELESGVATEVFENMVQKRKKW
jgi:hypothetical protein